MTLEELQPDYDDASKQPKTLVKTRHIDGVLYVAGRAPVEGQTEYDIMFISVAVEEEEAVQAATSTFGFRIPQPAEYLKGANSIIKDVSLRAGIDMDKCYYTACCKWVLPRAQRARPSKKIMKWGMPVLEDEIRRVKPKIIVCMGKHVYDMVGPQKISFDDAHGCWFWSDEYKAHMYVMHAPWTLITRPEHYETFRIDFKEVARRKEFLDHGGNITGRPFQFQVIRTQEELEDWLDHLESLAEGDQWPGLRDRHGNPMLSVDCEWHKRTHIDGQLRTIQFAWSETDAVVIEFRSEKNEWSFELGEDVDTAGEDTHFVATVNATLAERSVQQTDIDRAAESRRYGRVGKLLAATFDRINARYIGHHFSADAPWMNHWLGITTYERCVMDTEFAQQTVDESSELGLERGIAMKYTNLGRYDQDLVMWKRENKELCKDGYGYIPSKILHPYGAADVITPYRAYPLIKRQLEAQRLWEYYETIFNPFVTDVFTEFCMVGLPMDISTMDDLRRLFTFTKDRLDKRLKKRIELEATQKLKGKLMLEFGIANAKRCIPLIEERKAEELRDLVKQLLMESGKLADAGKWSKFVAHWEEAPAFNIRSAPQMARWLFDFEGLTPIKTTNQKAKGLPSMAWESVLELPPNRQALYMPAVDKQTLSILAAQLPTIHELLSLNAVGNLSKAFLKEADVYEDPDTGEETTEEHGLHAWVAGDKRIHGQMSTTETGRPRSWCPNTLNFPSYVNERIANAVANCVREVFEEGDLPENLMKWPDIPADKLPSIRACIAAPEDWILVESDYATAEMVALAVISGDKDLMRILFDPDPEWARLKPGHPTGAKAVRVSFSDANLTGVPESARNPQFIMHVWKDGKCLGPVTEDDLMRNDSGKVINAKYDIHWSLIERTYGQYRELLVDKIDRNAAKVLNFSSAYGASSNSLERKIESDTGVKPEEGTGERGLAAIAARQPRATEFLEEMARVPKERGLHRAASGRIRHCVTHAAGSGVGWRTRNSIESALGREMRNFPMQESVASTAARACIWLLRAYRRLNLQARLVTCLYDSVVSICPLEERFLVARLHQICMSELNTWVYDDEHGRRVLQYSIDNEFNYRWSTRPSKAEQKLLDDRAWKPASKKLEFLEKHPLLLEFAGLSSTDTV